uniref:Uncharacterized protein n=1 Tax=Anopheles maculatus TaxID=74869 RepID=A0A182T7Q5_9DIPT
APSTESNLSFVADVNLDDIPFIDEDDTDEEDAPGSRSRGSGGCGTNVSTQTTAPSVVVNSPSMGTVGDATEAPTNHSNFNSNITTTTGGNLPSIMINTASRRGSNASCRKTVSFDIINDHHHHHHPYDDGEEGERAKGGRQSNVEHVAMDVVNSDTFSTGVPLTSRVSNRLNNNQILIDNSGTPIANHHSTYSGFPIAKGSSEITCDVESNNNNGQQQQRNDDPQKSIAMTANNGSSVGELRTHQERPIDTIRDYVVRHFSGTANVNVNNNYYCSNTVDRRQRNIQLDSDETGSAVRPQDPLYHGATRQGDKIVDNKMEEAHFATDSNNAPSATLVEDNDHCNLLRNIQLLKADGAFVGAENNDDGNTGDNNDDPHQQQRHHHQQHHHLHHPGQGGAKVRIRSPMSRSVAYDSSAAIENSPTEEETSHSETTVKFGHGKVKALAKFYNSLKDTNNNVIKYAKPHHGGTTELSSQRFQKHTTIKKSNASIIPTRNRLSNDEEQQIVNQLKLWSEFGSDDGGLNHQDDVSFKRSRSYDTSLNNYNYDENDIPSNRKSYDRLDSGKIAHEFERRNRVCSPNIGNLHAAHHGLHPHTLPTGFLLRKVKMCSPDCKNIENQKVTLSFLHGRGTPTACEQQQHRTSCPDLNTARQTPRQLKKQHNILRLLKQINSKLNEDDASDNDDDTATTDEAS